MCAERVHLVFGEGERLHTIIAIHGLRICVGYLLEQAWIGSEQP